MKTLKLALTALILTLTTTAGAQEQKTVVSAKGVEISIEVVDEESGVVVSQILGERKLGQPPVLAACCVQPEKQAFATELISQIQTIANISVNSMDVCDKPKFARRLSRLLAAKLELPADAIKDGKSTLQLRRSDVTQGKILACLTK